MGILTDWITEWLRGLLIDGIMGNLEGLFTNLNNRVGEIAVEVGTSPATWNAGVFSLIRQLSETVVLPIAGIVLTFVMCYELIQMLIDRNNLHDIDTWLFFKWIIKTFIAVTILSNTFNIVMAVFDVAQSVVAQSAGLVQGTTDITPNICTPVSAANVRPGDLVFFVGTYDTPGVSHVGIYVGDGWMIHAGNPIGYVNLNTSYWQSHFYTYGRLP